MKSMILVVLALVAVAVAHPVDDYVPIVKSNYDQASDGGYNYGYEAGNGIKVQETGELKEVLDEENKPHVVIVVRGSYTYSRDDGTVETVNYVADDKGFFAEGPSIPKAERR